MTNKILYKILNGFTWYASEAAMTVQYEKWSDGFCRKEIKRSTDKFLDYIKDYINFKHITKEEALLLGFRKWSEEHPNLYLIPLYLLPIMPVGTELTSIFGEKIIYDGNNIGKDVRMGCVAYGVEIKEKSATDNSIYSDIDEVIGTTK